MPRQNTTQNIRRDIFIKLYKDVSLSLSQIQSLDSDNCLKQ